MKRSKLKRSKLVLVIAATLAAACEAPTAPDARALGAGTRATLDAASTSQTTFSGEATVVKTTVTPPAPIAPITLKLVETGPLDQSGGALEATLIKLEISKAQTADILALDATVGHASTVGQGKRSRSRATVADLKLDVNGVVIEADFLDARAEALCDAARNATATAGSMIAQLRINGNPITVGTEPGEVVFDAAGVRIVANEQTTKDDGASDADITVNALHVTARNPLTGTELADVIIASAHADIHCGLCTDKGDDFTTGGGWINPGDGRKNFAVAGGYKNGQPWGHLTYLDKAVGLKVKGTAVVGYRTMASPQGGTLSIIDGLAEANGTSVEYTVTVADNGEPGNADTFHIALRGGYTYTSGGMLGGGNIQFHDKPSPCPGT